jgi:hypothetical protein
LCVATDAATSVFVTSHPAGGATAWKERRIAGPYALLGVACPSVGLCAGVAALDYGIDVGVLATTSPTAGRRWHSEDVDSFAHIGTPQGAVACGAPTLCVAIAWSPFNLGDVFVSTRPTKHWVQDNAQTGTDGPFEVGVACAGTSLCVIIDTGGGVTVGTAVHG